MPENITKASAKMQDLLAGLITTREAAQRCGFHQRTIISWIHRGVLQALKLPGGRGQYFIDPNELDTVVTNLFTPVPYSPEDQ